MRALVKFVSQVLYNVFFVTFFLVTGPFFLFQLWRRGKLLPQFGQRFGFYSREVRERLKPRTDFWIHAVSVGEVMLASILVQRLREKRPDLRVVVSTTTATGFAVAQARFIDEHTTVIYNPIDFLWSVLRAFQVIRPRRLILVESEIWPNYLWCARRRHIPVYLVNARLSHRSEERYRRMRRLVRLLLQEIDLVFAQDEIDVKRLALAGFAPESIFNVGSLKYDVAALPTVENDISIWWGRLGWNGAEPVLLGGSTHPGEEEVLARIFLGLRERWPQLRLVLVPRHAERGGAVRELCERLGLRTVTRSQLAEATEPLPDAEQPEVLVVNSTGELRPLYRRATLAFVGKSLRGRGGQNFIEAAAFGTPIVVGPNMQNFEVIMRDFLARQAIVQVNDEFEMAAAIRDLLASDTARRELGDRAQRTFEAGLHAADRTAQALLQSLERN